jgi:hypothetical protein
MSLTELEQHIFAYYIAGDAAQFTAAPRFYPYGELVLIIEDKIQVATRKFGSKVTSKAKTVANALLDQLVEAGVYSTKQGEFGGTMHQFQGDAYRGFLKEQQEANPIILKARDAGPDFWDQAFAALANR